MNETLLFVAFCSGFALGCVFIIGIFEVIVLPADRNTHDMLYRTLERDREEARHEASVFRRLVLPVYDKAETGVLGSAASCLSSQPVGAKADSISIPSAPAHTSNPLFNRRTPWRIRSKSLAAAANTKQQNTDALAAELMAQKKEEKHA